MLTCSYSNISKKISDLNESEIIFLEKLYLSNYSNTDSLTFRKDLFEKDLVLIVYHGSDIVGFTTILNYNFTYDNNIINVIFSGDTIIDRKHWGQQELSKAFLKTIWQIKNHSPHIPLYWFLIVKGHRTYKFLNTFAKNYFPHFKTYNPLLSKIAISLAKNRYGDSYNQELGILNFQGNNAFMSNNIASFADTQLNDEATAFFFKANPGYLNGDELVCCCSLEKDNMTKIARRYYDRF